MLNKLVNVRLVGKRPDPTVIEPPLATNPPPATTPANPTPGAVLIRSDLVLLPYLFDTPSGICRRILRGEGLGRGQQPIGIVQAECGDLLVQEPEQVAGHLDAAQSQLMGAMNDSRRCSDLRVPQDLL